MEKFNEIFHKGWRSVVTAAFVLLVFTVPASKGVLSKWFSIHAANGNNAGNNQGNNHNSHSNDSAGYSSQGSPHSNPAASPVNPDDSCSTGRRHSHSHHGHHRHAHYRPNGH